MSSSKNNTENINQQTEHLKAGMAELNNTLLQVAKTQEALNNSLAKGSAKFTDLAGSADDAGESLKAFNKQINDNAAAINQSQAALQQNKALLADFPLPAAAGL